MKNELVAKLSEYYSKYLQGKELATRLCLISILSRGHVLVEDVPGLGKTTLALAIAKSMGLSFGRVQCTNDLLPSDITGVSVFNKESSHFEFQKGPIFNNIVLVDEINRATPKTQSALLEAMGEKQVTVEGVTYPLPKPFFVIATQNPLEQYGTFPLPESQLDRFLMKISIGYPTVEEEFKILKGGSSRRDILDSEAVISMTEFSSIQDDLRQVHISDKILQYLLEIATATRNNDAIYGGLSTRAVLSVVTAAKVGAFLDGRGYVIPEDIINIAKFTMPHRIIFKDNLSDKNKTEVLFSIIKSIKTPLP